MPHEIISITLSLPLKMSSVNCYLIKNDESFILIDTGTSNSRTALEKELEKAGCKPGNINIIIITHGDFDHIGNAVYLREKYGTKIAMHNDDSGMAEFGNMFWNRKKGNFVIRALARALFRFPPKNRFKPDLHFEDGFNLSEYGVDARILYLPGHSRGSIGILTATGDLFCGDLFENYKKPAFNSIMDDPETAKASVEKLKAYEIKTVYPGHGKSFPMELFLQNLR